MLQHVVMGQPRAPASNFVSNCLEKYRTPEHSIVVVRPNDKRLDIVGHCPANYNLMFVALGGTRLHITVNAQNVFDGAMRCGSIFVCRATSAVWVSCSAPSEMAVLCIPLDYFHAGADVSCEEAFAEAAGKGYLLKDPVIECLCRSLVSEEKALCVDQEIAIKRIVVMRLLNAIPSYRRVQPLLKWRLKRVEAFVQENLSRKITLPNLAKLVGLSQMHFAAQFRVATTFSPHEYILYARVEHAKTLLAATKMTLVEIAYEAGFQSQSHFTTAFKRFAGSTPARWKAFR